MRTEPTLKKPRTIGALRKDHEFPYPTCPECGQRHEPIYIRVGNFEAFGCPNKTRNPKE